MSIVYVLFWKRQKKKSWKHKVIVFSASDGEIILKNSSFTGYVLVYLITHSSGGGFVFFSFPHLLSTSSGMMGYNTYVYLSANNIW